MANTSTNLVGLDFNTYKNNLKAYLRSNEQLKDIDFEASNINVLLDVLAYNTFHNAFYLNMIANEMFLDSAQLRDSVISHVKELNYVPRSAQSSRMSIDVLVKPTTLVETVSMPRETTFTGRVGNDTFIFSTNENIVLTSTYNSNTSLNEFYANDVLVYEGFYLTETFIYDSTDTQQRLILSNPNIDLTSISLTVLEDGSINAVPFTQASSLFGYNSDSAVFFIQPAENGQYEIFFGNNTVSRRPKDGSIISCRYRVCNGDLPNGTNNLKSDAPIDGHNNITVTVIRSAELGAQPEDINSIKFNAPRFFQTQERAVTAGDYKVLLQSKFPEIQSVYVYGGEETDPPRFGRVIIAADVSDAEGISQTSIDRYTKYLRERSPVSIEPIFVPAEFMYVLVNTKVYYNLNSTNISAEDLKALVQQSIINFCEENINDFNAVLRYSKLIATIDNSHSSIISDSTSIKMVKYFNPLIDDMMERTPRPIKLYFNNGIESISTSLFSYYYSGTIYQNISLVDDGEGRLVISSTREPYGTVDYDTGVVTVDDIAIVDYQGEGIAFNAVPQNRDISAVQNTILQLRASDVSISVVGQYA